MTRSGVAKDAGSRAGTGDSFWSGDVCCIPLPFSGGGMGENGRSKSTSIPISTGDDGGGVASFKTGAALGLGYSFERSSSSVEDFDCRARLTGALGGRTTWKDDPGRPLPLARTGGAVSSSSEVINSNVLSTTLNPAGGFEGRLRVVDDIFTLFLLDRGSVGWNLDDGRSGSLSLSITIISWTMGFVDCVAGRRGVGSSSSSVESSNNSPWT